MEVSEESLAADVGLRHEAKPVKLFAKDQAGRTRREHDGRSVWQRPKLGDYGREWLVRGDVDDHKVRTHSLRHRDRLVTDREVRDDIQSFCLEQRTARGTGDLMVVDDHDANTPSVGAALVHS